MLRLTDARAGAMAAFPSLPLSTQLTGDEI
jgi:hypothetical protein